LYCQRTLFAEATRGMARRDVLPLRVLGYSLSSSSLRVSRTSPWWRWVTGVRDAWIRSATGHSSPVSLSYRDAPRGAAIRCRENRTAGCRARGRPV